jgi:hypothetical protein
MLVEFWKKEQLPIWGETNYFPRQEFISSFYCIDEGSSRSLLNLGTGFTTQNTLYYIVTTARTWNLTRFGAFLKLRNACLCVRPSGSMHRTTQLSLGGFSWNLVFEYFSKLCRENSSFVTIGQCKRVLYMNTNIHFFIISRAVLLRMRNVSDKIVEKIKTHMLSSITFF